MQPTEFQQALMAIQTEYVDMPGLMLTTTQMSRLCALPSDVCQAALETLVVAGFLKKGTDGSFVRCGTPPVSVESRDPLTWVIGRASDSSALLQTRS